MYLILNLTRLEKIYIESREILEKIVYHNLYELEDHFWWHQGQRQWVSYFIKKGIESCNSPLILDAGSGTGGMTNYIGKFGSVFGVDLSKIAISYCKQRGIKKLCRGKIQQIPFKDETFDVVTILGVMYHREVRSESTILKELFRVCKKNGKILLSEPAYNFLYSKHDQVNHGIRRYTRKQIVQLLEEAGFYVEKASYLNTFVFPITFFVRIVKNILNISDNPCDLKEYPKWFNKFLSLIVKIEVYLLRTVNFPFGSSVICVARKSKITL